MQQWYQWQIDNAAYIYKYFTSRGFTPESTCGMLGNMAWESGICSWRIQSEPLTSTPTREYIKGLGYGLVQWTESQYNVEQGLPFEIVEWCNQRRLPYWTVESQCKYLYYQMTNPVGMWSFDWYCLTYWEGAGDISQYAMSKGEFITSRRGAGFLAAVFCANFEKPAAHGANVQKRVNYAHYWYSQLASGRISSSQPAPVPVDDNPSPSYDGSYYPPASPDGRYQIQNGNTLSGIAAHFGVTVQELCQWNGIENPNVIYAGHYIYVTPHSPAPHPAGGIVIHVEKGDTLWGIAQRYGVTVQDLCDWNSNVISNPNRIYPGEPLVIYPGSVSTSSSPDCITYTVEKGDTLWGIAQRYGVTVQQLCDWNSNVISNPNVIYPGERLTIYTGSSSSPSGPTGWYTIQPGDTLWGIAQRYGVTVQDLCDWNRDKISNPNEIYPNTVIRV